MTVYLNFAGTSAVKPASVVEAVGTTMGAPPETHGELYERAWETLRGEFPSGQGRLLVTSGCTSALSLTLGELALQPGQVVAFSAYEHHALRRQVELLVAQRGLVPHELSARPGSPVSLSEVERLVAEEDVGVVAVTAASNLTGEPLPLRDISGLLQQKDVPLLVDGAQTFGTALFSEVVQSADLITVAGHKYALGPQGIGALYYREGLSFRSPTAACDAGEEPSLGPSFCDAGSVNLPGLVGLIAGLEVSQALGRQELARRLHGLAMRLRSELSSSPNYRLLGALPGSDELWNPVVSFVSEREGLKALQERLERASIVARVGTHCAPLALQRLDSPGGCARLSFGPSSTENCLKTALSALEIA